MDEGKRHKAKGTRQKAQGKRHKAGRNSSSDHVPTFAFCPSPFALMFQTIPGAPALKSPARMALEFAPSHPSSTRA